MTMNIRIGSAPDSWGVWFPSDPKQTPWERYLDEVAAAGITIPAHLVSAVVEAPYGAHPASCYPRYAYDRGHLLEYVAAAQSWPDGLAKYLATYVYGGEERYAELIGPERRAALAAWSDSDTTWRELFS